MAELNLWVAAAAAILAAVPSLSASQQRTIAKDSATILALEEQWRQASLHNDTAVFNRLMAPDEHAIRTDGVVTTRLDRLRSFASGSVITRSLDFSDLHVRLIGDVAIVTGLAARKDSTNQGTRDFTYRYTRIWQRRAGAWRVVEFQSTTVSPGNVGGLVQRDTAVARTIEALDWQRFQAVRRADVRALDTLLADDWLASGNNVATITKRQYLDELAAGTRSYGDIRHDDVVVRVYGDAAIVTGRSTGPYRINGREQNNVGRFTHVYVRRNGRWQMVSMQNTVVSDPIRSP